MDPLRLGEATSLYLTVKVDAASPVTTGYWGASKQILGESTDDPTSIGAKFVEHDAGRDY